MMIHLGGYTVVLFVHTFMHSVTLASSSEINGQLVGAKRSKTGGNRSDESFQKERKERLGNESLQTISKRLCDANAGS